MAITLDPHLRNLLLASQLGLNPNHPLAGWTALTILYHDAGTSGEPITLDYLARKYNNDYLDSAGDEQPISNDVLKKVLTVLADQAGLVEVSPRKVRSLMTSGRYHISLSYVYRITSSGIEYRKMMQRVVDAESTITANTNRIDEYVALVRTLSQPVRSGTDTKLYNNFQNMLTAYDDVMKGMHKLEDDLDELANDIAFNHGSQAAAHLQAMLREKAIPAYNKMLDEGARIQHLAGDAAFIDQVAHSQQGSDDLDAARATDQQDVLVLRFQHTRTYVAAQLERLALSMNPSTSAIDSSLDSIYLVFQTIQNVIGMLSREFEHARTQTIDIKALSRRLDDLLTHYQTVQIPQALPPHLPQDRMVEDPADLLDATTMGPVRYAVQPTTRKVATAADNPPIVDDAPDERQQHQAIAEFTRLVMTDATHGAVVQDLTFRTVQARDEVVKLYAATYYPVVTGFAPFGRPISQAGKIPASGPVRLHVAGEAYIAELPSGFTFSFSD